MKPQEHINPESWRHEDNALRRAVQQRNESLPQLPEGFAEKMRTQLPAQPDAEPATTARKTAHKRTLWPWITGAVAAAVIGVVMVIQRPSRPTPDPSLYGGEVAGAMDRPTPSRPTPDPSLYGGERASAMKIAVIEPAGKRNDNKNSEGSVSGGMSAGTTAVQSDLAANSDGPATDAPATDLPASVDLAANSADIPTSDLPPTDEQPTPSLTSHNTTSESSLLAQPLPSIQGGDGGGSSLSLRGGDGGGSFSHLASHHLSLSGGVEGGSFLAFNSPAPADNSTPQIHDSKYYLMAGEGYTYEDAGSTRKGAPQRAPQGTTSTEHRLPLTVALQLNIPLTHRLSLETGLGYTRLYSSFNELRIGSFFSEEVHTEQTLHYLGVPLHLHYDFVALNRLRIYALGGVNVEFPITTSAKETLYSIASTITTTNHPSAPVQFAPVVGVGMQLNVSRHVALFVQPTLQWYIPTGSSIESYRTEHPLTVALPFGFRWTL